METDCIKCTEAQKKAAKEVISYLINKKPDMWDAVCLKYDPKNILRSKHEQELKSMSNQNSNGDIKPFEFSS